MPEGPEIRRAADAIAEVLVGRRLETVRFSQPRLRRWGKTLTGSTLDISRRSYQTQGVTLAPRLAKRLEQTGLEWEQRRFYAYGREDCPCYHCGHQVVRSEANSRAMFHCPECQPRP